MDNYFAIPPEGHLAVKILANAINPGDKYFLFNPAARAAIATGATNDVWGASAVGRVTAIGKNVPPQYKVKHVAIYRSLVRTPETIGLWCQQAQIHYLTAAILPEEVNPLDYAGSLVNVQAKRFGRN